MAVIFFSLSLLPNVKTFLPIFVCDNKFVRFMFDFSWSNQHFAIGLWPHVC